MANALIERLKKSEDPALPRIKAFLDDAEALLKSGEGPKLEGVFSKLASDPTKNYSDIPHLLETFADGDGRQILQSEGMEEPEQRAQSLFAFVNEELLPKHRSGTAYLIGKFFEKNTETKQTATNLLARLSGFKTKNEGIFNDYIFAEMLDNGLTSFLASYVALFPGRMASNWVLGRWAAKYGPEMGWGRRIAGYGLSLTAGTVAYYASEKSLLGIFGFDGQILPKSGGEFFREFGADMIVMGLSNLLGGTTRRLAQDRALTVTSASSRWGRWLYKFKEKKDVGEGVMQKIYGLRAPYRGLLRTINVIGQPILLHTVQRWEDRSGLMPRFAPGKTTRFLLHMPVSWQNQLLEGYQVQSSEKILGQLLNHQLTVKDRTVTDQLYNRIASLKQWVVKLSPEATPEQEEMLLGVFWVAQEQGVFGGGAPDILLKWNNEKRYEKLNEYFTKKKIPLQVSPYGEFQFQE
jgi:hypothetical protein